MRGEVLEEWSAMVRMLFAQQGDEPKPDRDNIDARGRKVELPVPLRMRVQCRDNPPAIVIPNLVHLSQPVQLAMSKCRLHFERPQVVAEIDEKKTRIDVLAGFLELDAIGQFTRPSMRAEAFEQVPILQSFANDHAAFACRDVMGIVEGVAAKVARSAEIATLES